MRNESIFEDTLDPFDYNLYNLIYNLYNLYEKTSYKWMG